VFYTCRHKSWVYSVGGVFNKRHFLQKVLVGVKVLQREFWQNGGRGNETMVGWQTMDTGEAGLMI
jgi:hypothetical protein